MLNLGDWYRVIPYYSILNIFESKDCNISSITYKVFQSHKGEVYSEALAPCSLPVFSESVPSKQNKDTRREFAFVI
jgi:hypothetical protein